MIDTSRTVIWSDSDKVLHVARQFDSDEWPTVWTEHDFDAEEKEITLQVYGTGSVVHDGAEHIGSGVHMNGGLVWHVYVEDVSAPSVLKEAQ